MNKANKIIMTVAGLILVIAAVLKIHQLLTEPIISAGFWESWLFFVMQIPLEMGLGIWLLCGLFRKAAWLVAVISFGVFIAVTLQKSFSGAASCGCFGRVDVNPWITLFVVDAPFFLLLAVFQPKGEKLLPSPWPSAKHFFGVAIPTFVLLPAIVAALIFNKPPDKTDEYEVLKPQQWVTQKPDNHISKPDVPAVVEPNNESATEVISGEEWPLLEHIDIADSLRSSFVVVLLYHYDCPDCREAIPLYDRFSRQFAGDENAIQFAFIEAPPYDDEQDNPVPADTPSLTGRLDSSKEWIFPTPVVVLLRDGFAIKVWEAKAPGLEEILQTVLTSG